MMTTVRGRGRGIKTLGLAVFLSGRSLTTNGAKCSNIKEEDEEEVSVEPGFYHLYNVCKCCLLLNAVRNALSLSHCRRHNGMQAHSSNAPRGV